MPMYEYACKACGKRTEIIQKFSDAPIAQCPACGQSMERLISASAFVLKGGGWYKDGYSSSSSTSKPSADPAPTCEKTGKPADTSCACANPAKDK